MVLGPETRHQAGGDNTSLINKRMAQNYLSDATSILDEAKSARNNGLHHRAIRRSQESFELALRATLRAVGIEYPKEHEVSDALRDNITKFPNWLREKVPYLEAGSAWLSERRGVSMYGDEISGKPASQLFTPNDSQKALGYAQEAVETTMKLLLRELFEMN